MAIDADSDEFIALVDPHARDVTADKGYDTNANHQQLKSNGQRSSIIVKKNRIAPQIISQADPQSQRERPNIERKFAEQSPTRQGTPLKLRPSRESGSRFQPP